MNLNLRVATIVGFGAALCTVALAVLDARAPVSPQTPEGQIKLLTLGFLALGGGFLAGWLLGPIFGRRGLGGVILSFVGALLATMLASAICGFAAGVYEGVVQKTGDAPAILGSAAMRAGVWSVLMVGQILKHPQALALWATLALILHLIMNRSRRALLLRYYKSASLD